MAGLLILIIDRGIIKVALARGRFQLRISVSLGTIGSVGSGEGEREGEERRGKGQGEKSGDEWLRRVLYLLSVLLILYLLPQEDKPWVNNVRGFFQLILRNRRSLGDYL